MLVKDNLPIALVGCGNWGQNILRDLKELNCEVTVVCPTQDCMERAKRIGAKYIVENISQLKAPAGIVIATPTSTHLDVIASLLEFAVPIFVEKPLGTDLSQAKAIAAQAGDRIFVMDKWRYHPGIEELARIANSKELGNVIGLTIKQFAWGCHHQDVDFIDILLPHTLAITYEIFGAIPKPCKSYLITRNGEPVGFHGVLGMQPWMNFNVAINSPTYAREIILECALGVAVFNESCNKEITIYLNKNAQRNCLDLAEKRTVAAEMPLLRELRVFLNYLKGGAAPKSDACLGIKMMEAIISLRKLAIA